MRSKTQLSQVIIRGCGLVTPLGVGVQASWRSLWAGHAINAHTASPLNAPSGRVHALAQAVAAEALADSQWDRACLGDDATALIIGTSRGGIDDWLGAASDFEAPSFQLTNFDLPSAVSDFGLSEVAARLARKLGHGCGPRLTVSSACASGMGAMIRAVLLLQSGAADRALVVAAESSLHPLTLGSFQRLGVTAAAGERCRPFDRDRSGLLVSEAAAAITLERVDCPWRSENAASPDARKESWVAVDQFALAADAWHLTALKDESPALACVYRKAMDGRPVDLIHAHGTGTPLNDAAEARVMTALLAETECGGRLPAVYSHKGAIGHSLGAASLVSVVLNVQMHRRGEVPAIANLKNPIDIPGAQVMRVRTGRQIHRSLACAAGFGGVLAAVSLRSVFPDEPPAV